MNWSEPFWVVQQVEVVEGRNRSGEAQQILEALSQQEGFLCGRILRPAGPGWWYTDEAKAAYRWPWKIQAFFEDCGEENAPNLPDGMRRVMLTPQMKNWFDGNRTWVSAT